MLLGKNCDTTPSILKNSCSLYTCVYICLVYSVITFGASIMSAICTDNLKVRGSRLLHRPYSDHASMCIRPCWRCGGVPDWSRSRTSFFIMLLGFSLSCSVFLCMYNLQKLKSMCSRQREFLCRTPTIFLCSESTLLCRKHMNMSFLLALHASYW